MALSEFELIERYFAPGGARRDDVALGIGDDAALLRVPAGRVPVVAAATLAEDVDFAPAADPAALAREALSLALEALRASGAAPAWLTLSLTLPSAEPPWLEAFSGAFLALAAERGLQLVGGDVTRGPRALTVAAHGTAPGEGAAPP